MPKANNHQQNCFHVSNKIIINQFSIFFFQLYHGEIKLIFNDDEVRFVLDQHSLLDFYSASSLKQQSPDRHVAPLRCSV